MDNEFILNLKCLTLKYNLNNGIVLATMMREKTE